MSAQRLAELNRLIAASASRARRLTALIERQRALGTPTTEAAALLAEVETFIASLELQRDGITGE